jgi:pimeloyl-ACP methyl ester carboxylesterase
MEIQPFYLEQGAGVPLVLLHGNGESSAYFEHQMPVFAKHFHVFAVDTRGHGQTPRGEKPFTLSQFADDLRDFLDAQGLEKAHILGFSDGGNIALLFALRHPEMVDKLILNGANLFPAGVKKSVQLPIVLGYRIAKLFKSEEAKRNAETLALMVNEPKIDPAELQKIASETLVIVGTHDMICNKHTKLIAASLPNAKLVLLDGDHFIAAKQPEAFNKAVLDFLLAE